MTNTPNQDRIDSDNAEMLAISEAILAEEVRKNRIGPIVKATRSLSFAARSAAIAANQLGAKETTARLESAENVLNSLALAIDAGYSMEWLVNRIESQVQS
jgi:hypothetical protein